MIFADSHIHITNLAFWQPLAHDMQISPVCSCAHSAAEWEKLLAAAQNFPSAVLCAAGIHPQDPDKKHIPFLLQGLEKKQVDAIGESGFDLFAARYADRLKEQEQLWTLQLELAVQYKKPLIVHCRRALDKIFRDCKKLAKLDSVIFHSFAGSPGEALSLIKRGVRARFSFGKPLLNGNKRALRCAALLPADMLLAETDAPWQTLKGEASTDPADIKKVYEKIADIRGMSLDVLSRQLYENFKDSFGLV